MTPEEQKLFRLYGKMPNKKDLLQNKLKVSWNPSSPALRPLSGNLMLTTFPPLPGAEILRLG
jgi:hypothetical protein